MTKILIDEATVKLALEALEYIEHNYMSLPAPAEKAITSLREALAEQQQEPVAWAWRAFDPDDGHHGKWSIWKIADYKPPRQSSKWFQVVPLPFNTQQPAQQEPFQNNPFDCGVYLGSGKDHVIKHHVSYGPAQRTWVNATMWRGLTDEDSQDVIQRAMHSITGGDNTFTLSANKIWVAIVREVEAKLRSKNEDRN